MTQVFNCRSYGITPDIQKKSHLISLVNNDVSHIHISKRKKIEKSNILKFA